MLKLLARCALLTFTVLPATGIAEPVTLKLAYYTSDQTRLYKSAIKPFVQGVNSRDGVKVEVYPVGTLEKNPTKQLQLIRDGKADIAFIVLGLTDDQFPDHSVMELPGLFNNLREATLVHTRLVASGIMHKYDEFFVIGAFSTDLESIHTLLPIARLEDLKGKRIRANNPVEAATLAKLGATPVLLPIAKVSEAINRGTIDGAATAPPPLRDFGIMRAVTHHYLLRLAPTAMIILMNRNKFESLSKKDQDIIQDFSGESLAESFIQEYEPYNKQIIEELIVDPLRSVVFPTPIEIDRAEMMFKKVREEWVATAPRNQQLLNAAEAELKKLRSIP